MRKIVFALLLFVSPAHAANTSIYTDFDLKKCKQLTPATSGDEGEGSGIVECKGFKNYPITFAEGDLRSFMAFGEDGQNHCSFHQTFSGFNSIGSKIEWRLNDGKAIATIFRWSVSYDPEDSVKQKSWLVVTKLGQDESCQMGFVEGGVPNANEKARALADTRAEDFSCVADKATFIANPGTATVGIVTEGGCDP